MQVLRVNDIVTQGNGAHLTDNDFPQIAKFQSCMADTFQGCRQVGQPGWLNQARWADREAGQRQLRLPGLKRR